MNLKDEWRRLALDLGFDFKEGIQPFLDSPTLIFLAGDRLKTQDVRQARLLLANPMVQGLLNRIFLGAATGVHQGFAFVLLRMTKSRMNTTGNASPTAYVHVTLLFARDLGLGLTIRRGGAFSGLGRLLMPGRYLPFARDERLSQSLTATARNREGATALLATPEMAAACRTLYAEPGDFTVTDHCMRWKEPGHILDKARAVEIMDHLAAAAACLPGHVTRLQDARAHANP